MFMIPGFQWLSRLADIAKLKARPPGDFFKASAHFEMKTRPGVSGEDLC